MKNIIIPKHSDTSIDLSKIDKNTKGIIIVYSNRKPVGYINYDKDSEWVYRENINLSSIKYAYYKLVDLIDRLYKVTPTHKILEFKLLEFDSTNSIILGIR